MTHTTTPERNATHWKGVAAACSVVLIWSGWIVSSRWGLNSNIEAIDLTWLRFTTAAIITLPLAIKYNWRTIPLKKALIISLGCGFPYVWFAYLGLQFTPSANASVLINGLLPVVTSLLAYFFLNKKITTPLLVLILTACISNALLASSGAELSVKYFIGLGFLLGATLVISIYMVAVKAWDISLREIMVWVPIINAICVTPFWFAFSDGFNALQAIPLRDLFFHIVYQGIIVSVAALFLFSYAIKSIGALAASLFMAFVPTTTALLAFVTINEHPTVNQWLAITLCTLGLVGYNIYTDKEGNKKK